MNNVCAKNYVWLPVFLFMNTWISAVDLQVPNRETIASIPNGMQDGTLLYGKKNPYEPYSPVEILTTDSGDFVVINGLHGIVLFDRNWKFRAKFGKNPEIYSGMTIYDSYLIAWPLRLSSEPQVIEVFDLRNPKNPKYSTGQYVGQGRTLSVSCFGEVLAILTDTDNLITMKLTKDKMLPGEFQIQDFNERPSRITFDSGRLYGNQGVITSSAEVFFQVSGKPEIQIASIDGNNSDDQNLASGTIFGVDGDGNRYIYVSQNRIGVANMAGDLIKVFNIWQGNSAETQICIPCITKTGDILYIESTKAEHKVIKIARNW